MTALHDFFAWLPSGLPAYIFLITVVVFFHELGHFSVARWCGVAVETFSIGFGPEIVGWNDRHGTRWKISWIPFGGYVKFLGDIGAASTPDRDLLEDLPEEERNRTFPLKPLWQRAAIVAAGPFANFILAIVIFTAMFMIFGQSYNRPVVDGVQPGSPAALAGIHKGDVIRSINGNPIRDFSEIKQVVTLNTGETLAIGLERGGRLLTVNAAPKITTMKDPFGGVNRMMALGVINDVKADRISHVRFGPVEAVGAACAQTWLIVKSTFVYMWQMSTGYADTSQLRGPIGVASVSQKVASISFVALITLAALMSVSIELINLFPIPLLDGGHLLYYGFEAVLGRPLGVRAQDVGFRLGLAMVLGLMVLVTWNDLARLDLFSETTTAVTPGGQSRDEWMKSIADLSARILRTAALSAVVIVTAGVAGAAAQALNPKAPSSAPSVSLPLGPPIRQIMVAGTQRIEAATVLSYISIREGDPYDEQAVDRSLKTLFATGLFADVKFRWNGQVLTIQVVENPIINQIDFEGNDKVSTKDLQKEVQLKPRTVFTRARVQSDVQRIIELYRRNGKFAASVDPQIIQRPQNRVDLIFAINEGATTGVARITFIGNKAFDDDTLRGNIATEESAWWKFLATNDNYDPDRLTFDREQLRRFYLSHGYADFNVVSAVAQLTPDRSAFYLTFTIDEGPVYKFGDVQIESSIKELDPKVLRAGIPIHTGDTYNAELIQKSIDALTNAAGTKGYAFAEVHPRIRRDRDKRTIGVVLKIDQGPRVYVERINITGNTRTLDKIVRREMRLVEGDAFNRVLLDRSRTRIRALGFFKDVDIKTGPGSAPDKTVLNVAVTEQSTGELSLGAGYSSQSSFVGEFSYTERNLFGRAQYLRLSAALSSISKQFQISFTEPYFLDRPLAAGVDLIKYLQNFDQADYQGDTTAATFRLGFPTSEFGSVQLRYSYRIDKVTPYNVANIPQQILDAAGTTQTSLIGFTFSYNTLDDYAKPTRGLTFSFSQDFAGFGGTLKYVRAESSFSVYKKLFFDGVVGSLSGSAGYIEAYDGQQVRINERFFKGGDSFRGFQLAGIGPRDVAIPGNSGAIGGNVYAIGSINIRMPNFLPEDYGISTSLFSDFGTLGRIDRDASTPTAQICKHVKPGGVAANSCIADNLALRASAGISVGWKSPFGPIQIDFGIPIAKTPYDRTEIIHFSAGTGL